MSILECNYNEEVTRTVFNGEKVDLGSVKLVVCDYDDTACIHLSIGLRRLKCARRCLPS